MDVSDACIHAVLSMQADMHRGVQQQSWNRLPKFVLECSAGQRLLNVPKISHLYQLWSI